MAINFTRYIDITSGVGAAAAVPERQLIGRLFTDNNILPPQSFIEFDNAEEVGDYFGTSSTEYLRAVYYFSFVSKDIVSPQKISYARWVSAAVAPRIYGYVDPSNPQLLADYTSISAGSFGLTIGGVVNTFTALDFTGAASLAAVAAILQTAIRTKTGVQWTAATVTYDSVRGSFDFVGGSTGAATISVQEGVGGTPIAAILGWLPAASMVNGIFVNGAITAPGSAVETLTASLNNSANASNNFGSFTFIPTLTLTQHIEVANWNKDQNVLYQYQVAVSSANASAWAARDGSGLGLIGGTGLTLMPVSTTNPEYPEMFPMMILAATDYEENNSVQNYMFQQTTLTPSVTDDTTANTMDGLKINFYGQTQTAGQLINFYQKGVLLGIATDPLDMNTYANEQWLKNAISAQLMTLLLSLAEVSANAKGRGQILAILQSVINVALSNGTISVGKTLTTTQKLYISQVTGDPNAWYQVQTIGYWVNCVIVASSDVPPVYTAKYILVYSKDDVIRKVTGQDVLI